MENKFTQVDMTKDPQDMESHEIGLALYDIVHDTAVGLRVLLTPKELQIVKLACDHLIAIGIEQ